ncbi:WYL domain-containing protein [Pseudomonas berkeleyensis]|uniref:WYL domain-containing protein n=1 Tax=Pseudomonas berkeleyensis TaxID=2726956 RepID=A0A7G5DMD2_9PSED|nr:WYL domain-containing protein [Pseudomonas berkeleyensis]QMV62907.1 WYL domain-containing protein [Pseudomonas berkeleyensis]WSO38361.1 WYL domain-containing protein [Pseudomonas berkeleyensis]
MPEAKDTLLRLFNLLRLIPEFPRYHSTSTLHEKLCERGFSVDLRTVQRDLQKLSTPFNLLVKNEDEKEHGAKHWCHSPDAPIDLRDMEPSTALALYLAESHLQNLLPQSVLDLLAPQFNRARNSLNSHSENSLAHWAQRVRALPNSKALLPAEIDNTVWQHASNALLEGKQLRVHYLSRSKGATKPLLLHPAGLISRHSISYLIASVDGYDDLRQFALHRIQQAEALSEPARERPDFEISHYIRQDLNSAAPIEQVELIADVSPQIAWLLGETPLSPEQSLEPLEGSDWQRLRARVPDDQETLWWVFGLGENVRVLEPKSWVDTIQGRLAKLEQLYTPYAISEPTSVTTTASNIT